MARDNGRLGIVRRGVGGQRHTTVSDRSSRTPSTTRGTARVWHGLWALALLGALALAGCAGQSNAKGGATPTPPKATPTPQVLYTADWSHGADGWKLPPHWSVQNGQLVNDGKGTDAIPIPFALTQQQYTVEMDLQVVDYTCSRNCNEYGFVADGTNGVHLYVAEADEIDMLPPHHGFSLLTSPHFADQQHSVATQDFIPGTNVRTYTVSVDGNIASFAISGSGVGSVATTLPLSPANLSISDQHVQLIISSLTITTP